MQVKFDDVIGQPSIKVSAVIYNCQLEVRRTRDLELETEEFYTLKSEMVGRNL